MLLLLLLEGTCQSPSASTSAALHSAAEQVEQEMDRRRALDTENREAYEHRESNAWSTYCGPGPVACKLAFFASPSLLTYT